MIKFKLVMLIKKNKLNNKNIDNKLDEIIGYILYNIFIILYIMNSDKNLKINNIELCKHIQLNINKLSNMEIDEIFKILHKNNSVYTQNNNGIFVNLNWIDDNILIEINNYIIFCLKSQNEIKNYEKTLNKFNDTINNYKEKIEDKKDNISLLSNDEELINTEMLENTNKTIRISSSMKFYLFKKRFLKKNLIPPPYLYNSLTHEEYLKK